MDDFGWFEFSRVGQHCTPKLADVLMRKLDLEATLSRVLRGRSEPLAA